MFTNSYLSDAEKGAFIHSEEKLKKIANALHTPYSKLKELLIESKLESMGITEQAFIGIFKDYPHLTKKDKRAIINTYLKIKAKNEKKRIRRIIQKAKALYKRYGLEKIDSVVENLGVMLYETLTAKNIKEVYFANLKAIIIKPNLHPYERKYLIAHALGHHLFHRKDLFRDYISLHEKGIFGSLGLGRIKIATKEREADMFAAYFLIPEEKLKLILEEERVKTSSNPIPGLAKKFQVPEELMRKRLEFDLKYMSRRFLSTLCIDYTVL